MDYIEYKGRKVPTLKTLQKQGLAESNGQIKNQELKVKDDDVAIPKEYLNSIVWNLQRYSSYTYIERMLKLLEAYVPGYEKDVIALGSYPSGIEELRRMYKNIAEITNALKLIRNGYPNEGYVNILYQNAFKEFFSGRMLQENDYESLGYRRDGSVGLFSWVEKAISMYYRITSTLSNEWHVPFAFDDKYQICLQKSPFTRDFQRSSYNSLHKTGEIIPKNGIWNPVTFNSGCPNYLCAGFKFPQCEIAVEKIFTPEYIANDGDFVEYWEDYNYENFQCDWELLWEDTRYINGDIPVEESEYLDESIAFPLDPPEPPNKSQ